ncbi:MAG: acyl-CoA desaturase [Acidobacteriota bacterium]
MRSTQLTDERPWTRPWWQYSKGNGSVLFYIVSVHLLALMGLILFPLPSWPVLAIALTVASIGGVGITVCYHRCLAHRSLRLNLVVENILIFFAIFNASGEPMSWVANHRHHHAKADTEEDVSSPRHGGFWWAHIRWIYQWSGSDVRRWCPDMDKPQYRVWKRLLIPIIALSIFSGLMFGWEAFFWLGAIRLVYVLHLQMVVNSLLHMTPGLPEGVDSSRNIWWVGPLQTGAWGENWHRNHHSDANAARFGRRWWQIDVGWYVIRALKALRLASDVRLPREVLKKSAALDRTVRGQPAA